jgi:hypothetical protein
MNSLANVYADNEDGLVDLRKTFNHPSLLVYSEIFSSALLLGDTSNGRVLPYFSLDTGAPFKVALDEAFRRKGKDAQSAVLKAELTRFYYSFRPGTVNEWFKIDFGNPLLSQYPPWYGVLPWRARSMKGLGDTVVRSTKSDNERHGVSVEGIADWSMCGPVTESKVDAEVERLCLLQDSIRKQGYQRSALPDGDVCGTALIRGDDWVWLITHGYHRACVLAAMGHERIPVRINKVVFREHAGYWPHVVDGLYATEEAIMVFDKIFVGGERV